MIIRSIRKYALLCPLKNTGQSRVWFYISLIMLYLRKSSLLVFCIHKSCLHSFRRWVRWLIFSFEILVVALDESDNGDMSISVDSFASVWKMQNKIVIIINYLSCFCHSRNFLCSRSIAKLRFGDLFFAHARQNEHLL